jgi:DNA ligase-1
MEVLSLPDLYKLGTKGETRIWTISVIKDKSNYIIKTVHGTKDGEKITDLSDPVKGKNIGRSNETTPKDQAISEATSKWQQKKDRKGYSEEEGSKPDSYLRPMLAHKFEDKQKYVQYPAYAQRKYNGVRCLASLVDGKAVLWSRQGVEYSRETLKEIHEELDKTLKEDWVFDGELYSHEMSLQDINAAVKKRRDSTKDIRYVVYDMPDLAQKSCEYRMGALTRITDKNYYVQAAGTVQVKSEEELKEYEAEFIAEGYEGLMYRSRIAMYSIGHRSAGLLKVKRFVDDEFKIVSAKEGTNRESGTVVWICELPNGKTFETRPKGSLESRRQLWKDKEQYMGKMLKVKYQELSNDGVPIFPVGIAIREDWD